MKRQLTSILLFSALLVGGASTFVSCTDHESDSAYNTSISLADAIAKEKQALIEITDQLETKAAHAADKEELLGRIRENKELIDNLENRFTTAFGQYASLDEAVAASKLYTDEKIEEAKDELSQSIEALRGEDAEAREQLESSLLEKISANGDAIASEAEARQQLKKNYDLAFGYLVNKNLSSIAINATENPVLGYYNAAFLGSQLNLASSFYGTAAAQNQDWDITKGEFLNDGNAGKIYITLNPTEIEPACITDLKLVDSQGNEAKGFKLGDEEGNLIKKTDRVLTYGFTKAPSANGFYEVPVRATDPANDDFSLNKGELKDAAKNIIAKLQNPKESNLNLSQIATTLYSTVNNQLKAYTVKATYRLYDPTQSDVKKRWVKKTQVAPAYNMAAFAVKPLSYNTLKDNQSLKNLGVALDKYMLPTLSDKLGKFMDALDFQIKNEDGKQIKAYSFITTTTNSFYCVEDGNDVVIIDRNGNEKQRIPNSRLANSLYGYYENWAIYKKVPYETPWGMSWRWERQGMEVDQHEYIYVIETTDNTIDELIGSINDQIGTQLQPVKDAITNAATKWDNAITPVNNLLHKINGHISDVNQLLQPTMLYKSSKTNSWNTLSTLKGKLGTRMTGTGSTVLVATSWTGELLAPAYKKSVYVKGNPAGAKVTLMDGKTPAKKFAGSTQKVLFTATAKGNYTIVYEAVDYSGVSAKKEYHITVE